jgi:hypothetical protein
MPRALALWIAFTGWGAMFGLTLILAAVVLGGQMVTALIVQEP